MLIKKEERTQIQIAEGSYVWEYKSSNKNIGIALAQINGRYPDKGVTINKVCDEVYFVVSGSGAIFIEGQQHNLTEGDVFVIAAGIKYYVEGKELKIVTSNSPEWYPEQQEILK